MSRRNSPADQGLPGDPRPPVRDRIDAAANELFSTSGLRAVSVEQIAWRADTNSRAVVKYFGSHEGLVAHYLEQNGEAETSLWAEIEADYPEDPEQQLLAWVRTIAGAATDPFSEVCVLTSAAVELMFYKRHAAHRVIRKSKI